MKKKILAEFFAICLIFSLCIQVSATSDNNTYTIGNKTIIFSPNTSLDTAKQEQIAYLLVYGDDGVAPCGLLCTLFGHKYETEYVETITHYAASTDPCCLKEIFKVDICSRCDDSIVECTSSRYISCCPAQ